MKVLLSLVAVVFLCVVCNSTASTVDAPTVIRIIRRGMNVTLNCNRNFTNISLIIWKKPDNGQVPIIHDNLASETSLKIENVSFSNSGQYSCIAYSPNGPQYGFAIDLIVKDVPDPPFNVCLTSFTPTSLVATWNFGIHHNSPIALHTAYLYQEGSLIQQQNVSAPRNSLTFTGLESSKCYSLVLRALNDMGWSVLSRPVHSLTSRGGPEIRPIVAVHDVSKTTIILRFEHSKFSAYDNVISGNLSSVCGNSDTRLQSSLLVPLSNYVVYVSSGEPKASVTEHVQPVNPGENQLLIIPNLQPFTQYNVSVAFKNAHTRGPMSQLLIRTAEDVPDYPVIESSSATNNSVTVHWANGQRVTGVITGYKLELYRCGSNQHTEPDEALRLRKQQIDSSRKQFTFGVLDSNACYDVRIAAATTIGFGPFSELYSVYTDLAAPLPPELLSAKFIESNDILLNWTCSGLCASHTESRQNHFIVCWSTNPATGRPTCLRTQTFDAAHQAFCDCDVTRKFHTTVLPWSILQHSNADQALFTVRSVRKRSACLAGPVCEKESMDSNFVSLDLRDAPAPWRMSTNIGFRLDGTTLISIVAIALFVFSTVMFAACFASRLRCVFPNCQWLFYRRSVEPPIYKYRRAVPLRLNKTTNKPVLLSELYAYVTAAHADNDAGFQAEFGAIEQAVCSTDWTAQAAKLPENLAKNRYSNVLAYDHTRVILKEVTHRSDYINANYIDGYHRRAAYIATQGPTPVTFDDFWLMVWEQACNVIVMISNFVERGRRKCDKYWPTGGQQLYGNICVRIVSETVRAFFTIRIFAIRHVRCKRGTKERLVHHYQYTDWRDFDVPPSPLPVLKFVEASVAHWTLEDGPIVVHCSAGVGRTGTYICIESLIRQLKVEQMASIRGFLEHIRRQRMKLVQTEQQYAFIHDALREHALNPCHTIRPTHFADYLSKLHALDSSGRTYLERQYEMCVDSSSDSTDMSRSRIGTNIVRRRGSCSLYGSATTELLGINASSLHGYFMLSEYIVARHPLAGTETEFWKMVWDENSSIIVCLSGSELPSFWPNKSSEVRDIGWLHVSYAGSSSCGDALTRFEFLLTSDREDYALACTLWRLDRWPSADELGNGDESTLSHSLLDLATYIVEDEEEEDGASHTATGSIVVVDDSGGHRVGTFCALRILINQFTHEFSFDVYFVFKMLCIRRPGMFQSHRDLEFIYTLLQYYLSREERSSVVRMINEADAFNSMSHGPSANRLGSHCRRRTKVMVSHLFPLRHKTRLSNCPYSTDHNLVDPDKAHIETANLITFTDNYLSESHDDRSVYHGSTRHSLDVHECESHISSVSSNSHAPASLRPPSRHSHSEHPIPSPQQDLPHFSTHSLPLA